MYLNQSVSSLSSLLPSQGIVGGIQDMFGYIECSNKEIQAAFHLSEVMEPNVELSVGDEVEYSPVLTRDKVHISIGHIALMCMNLRTYVHTYVYTYVCTYVHTYVPTYIRAYV